MTTTGDAAFAVANLVHTDEAALVESTASDYRIGSTEPGTRSSAGEHALHTGGVAGSIPAASTIRPGWVYVVRGALTGLMKIGKCDEPEGRLKALQCASPDRLEVVAVYRTDDPGAEEWRQHLRFEADRAHGEWFRPADALVDWAHDETPTPVNARVRVQAALDATWFRRDATSPVPKRRAAGARARV